MNTYTVMQNLRKAVQNALLLHNLNRILFAAIATGMALVLSALALSMFSPDSAELAASVIRQAGVLCALVALSGFGVHVFVNMGAGARDLFAAAEAQPVKALPARVPVQVAIPPDIMLIQQEGETGEAFADRIDRARMAANPSVWVVVIPFRSPVVTILKGKAEHFFERGSEPFAIPEGEAVPADVLQNVKSETYQEYVRYVRWFARPNHWPKYSDTAKIEARPALETLTGQMRATVVTLVLVLSAVVSGFGQSKARQVDEALGTRIREIPSAGVRVEFEFREGNKTRTYLATGNGQRDYVELLQHCGTGLARYKDEGGTLICVRKNGEVVARGAAQGSAATSARPVGQYQFQPSETGDPVRPRGLFPGQGQAVEPESFDMPDSMQIAERLEQAKEEITGWKAEMWRSFTPVWEFLMWLFSSVLVLLICAICVLRYIAKTAANESLVSVYGHVIAGRWIVSIQQNSAAMTLIFVWSIAVVLLINLFLWMTYAGWSIWAMIPAAALVGWFAERVTDWIVPDLRVVQNNGRGITPY